MSLDSLEQVIQQIVIQWKRHILLLACFNQCPFDGCDFNSARTDVFKLVHISHGFQYVLPIYPTIAFFSSIASNSPVCR